MSNPINQDNHPNVSIKLAQSGYTIIELIIAIAVGSLILAGAAVMIQKVFSGSNVARETQNINLISTQMRTLRSSAGYGADGADLVPLLIDLEMAPNGLINGKTLVNSWNGSVNIKSTGTSFKIDYDKVPKEDCAKLITPLSQSGTFASVEVNGTTKSGPISAIDAKALCTDIDENKLTFVSRR